VDLAAAELGLALGPSAPSIVSKSIDGASAAPHAGSLANPTVEPDVSSGAPPPPRAPSMGATLAQLWLAAARAYMRLHKWDDALYSIQSAAAAHPAYADVFCAVRALVDCDAGDDLLGTVALTPRPIASPVSATGRAARRMAGPDHAGRVGGLAGYVQ